MNEDGDEDDGPLPGADDGDEGAAEDDDNPEEGDYDKRKKK